jgi:hypothetical protein
MQTDPSYRSACCRAGWPRDGLLRPGFSGRGQPKPSCSCISCATLPKSHCCNGRRRICARFSGSHSPDWRDICWLRPLWSSLRTLVQPRSSQRCYGRALGRYPYAVLAQWWRVDCKCADGCTCSRSCRNRTLSFPSVVCCVLFATRR